MLGKNRVGFELGEYDRERELIIDPVIYSTYLGGSRQDTAMDVAVDPLGNIYLASSVNSNNFLNPDLPGSSVNLRDVVVTKLNPSGTQIIYNTFISGSRTDDPYAIDVDSFGNAYIGGYTNSPNFPLSNAHQTNNSSATGGSDGFITKLNSSGTLVYSTYHGSVIDNNDFVEDLNVDSAGNAYVVGTTRGNDFPVLNGYQTTLSGVSDAFLSKLSPSGVLLYSTYFGGAFGEVGGDVDVDDQGNAFITGLAGSTIPLRNPCYSGGSGRGFAARFDTNADGNASLIYSSKLINNGWAIAVDSGGNARVISVASSQSTGIKLAPTGNCLSWNFPLTNGSIDDIAVDTAGNSYYAVRLENSNILSDGFLIRKSLADGTVAESVVLNGSQRETPTGIAYNGGFVYAVGYTSSLDFPTTPDALQLQSRYTGFPGSSLQGFLAKVQFSPSEERNPLIFIPGIMGSSIRGNWNGVDGSFWVNINQTRIDLPSVYNLTLDTNSIYYTDGLYASDVLRTALGAPVYEPLLSAFQGMGYKPYNVNNVPPSEGCDLSQKSNDPNLNPSLFVFPYDWRQDNNQTADKLREYIQCVQQFYSPATKIDVVAHSMGGLVIRRYILQSRLRNEPHGLEKVVTLATPYLGASEAINKLYTGGSWDVLGGFWLVASPGTIKFLSPHMPSMHQLFPSRIYHQFNGGIIKESGDVNGNGIPDENYSFSLIVAKLDSDFPETTPGTVGAGFHDFVGQDNWQDDQSGIEYYHIAAEQNQLNTTVGLSVKNSILCRIAGNSTLTECHNGIRYTPKKGLGDKTVPIISATRTIGTTYLGTPNSRCLVYRSPLSNRAEEGKAEHTEMTKQPIIHDFIAYFLEGIQQQPVSSRITDCVSSSSINASLTKFEENPSKKKDKSVFFVNAKYSSASVSASYSPSQYLIISGITEVTVRDETGNTASIQENRLLDNQVDGLMNYETIGENTIMLTFSIGHTYTVEFNAGIEPFGFDMVEGIGNEQPTVAVRYNDVSIPFGSKVKFTVSPDSSTNLEYDEYNDGGFESSVFPTAILNGAEANDTTPPTVNISITQEGDSATAIITAQDEDAGIGKIWYSFDGQNFRPYTARLTLAYSPNSLKIYSFADDNAANRSGLMTKTFNFTPIQTGLAVRPILECVAPNPDGSYTAKFGYENFNSIAVTIPLSEKNKFTPVPKNRGQVTLFQTGRVFNAFSVTLTENNLKWHLTGPNNIQQNVSASRNSLRCQ